MHCFILAPKSSRYSLLTHRSLPSAREVGRLTTDLTSPCSPPNPVTLSHPYFSNRTFTVVFVPKPHHASNSCRTFHPIVLSQATTLTSSNHQLTNNSCQGSRLADSNLNHLFRFYNPIPSLQHHIRTLFLGLPFLSALISTHSQ